MKENIVKKNIEIVSYSTDWPCLFKRESINIAHALQNNCIDIHHIGSTSVPGLAAKPKIDIIAVVKNGEKSISSIQRIGYIYKGEWNIPFHYGFTKRSDISVNLHVYEKNHPEIELNLIFRNHLRSNDIARDEYESLKQNLLQNESSFEKNNSIFTGYNLGKDQFIRNIIEQSGFNKIRFLRCTHYAEWNEYKRIQKEQTDTNYHFNINSDNHFYFILCKGVKVISASHIKIFKLNNKVEFSIIFLGIDEFYKGYGFDKTMLQKIKKWVGQR